MLFTSWHCRLIVLSTCGNLEVTLSQAELQGHPSFQCLSGHRVRWPAASRNSIWARGGPDAEQRAMRSLRVDLASGRSEERKPRPPASRRSRAGQSPAYRLIPFFFTWRGRADTPPGWARPSAGRCLWPPPRVQGPTRGGQPRQCRIDSTLVRMCRRILRWSGSRRSFRGGNAATPDARMILVSSSPPTSLKIRRLGKGSRFGRRHGVIFQAARTPCVPRLEGLARPAGQGGACQRTETDPPTAQLVVEDLAPAERSFGWIHGSTIADGVPARIDWAARYTGPGVVSEPMKRATSGG
jgi:hypothetical protein